MRNYIALFLGIALALLTIEKLAAFDVIPDEQGYHNISPNGYLKWYIDPVPEGDFDILSHFEISYAANEVGPYTTIASTPNYGIEYPERLHSEISLQTIVDALPANVTTGFFTISAVNSVGLKSVSSPFKFKLDSTKPSQPNGVTVYIKLPSGTEIRVTE
jgi:hypothetical protein